MINVRVNNDSRRNNGGAGSATKYKSAKEVETARESASTHKETRSIKARIEKWTGISVREKVFRFRVCGADGHSYRFRVGTKRRRTGW